MTPGDAYAAIVLLVWCALFVSSWRGISRTPRFTPVLGGEPRLTVYVPARDEAEVIEACVRGLLAQPELATLVVIDDGSTDGTRAILERLAEPRLVVLSAPPPAPGACGKPSALAYAVETVPPEGAHLAFVDADVVLAPGALGAMLAAADAGAELVTAIPEVTLSSALDQIAMPSIGALVMASNPPSRVMDPGHPAAFANGQLLLVSAARYAEVGGHGAVAREVLEDVRLAARMKAAGARLYVGDGRAIARTRMYSGWAELREGWSKNLYLLVGGTRAAALGWIAATLFLGFAGLSALAIAGQPLGVLAFVVVASMQATLRIRGGASAAYALLAPLGALLAAYILARSLWLHEGRAAIPWKGRRY